MIADFRIICRNIDCIHNIDGECEHINSSSLMIDAHGYCEDEEIQEGGEQE